jgi:molecular chaperone DnaK (HSP70)
MCIALLLCYVYLGTTFSCVGVFQPGTGTVDIFHDDENHYCFPSVVAFL